MTHDVLERAPRLVRICAAPRLYVADVCVDAEEVAGLLALVDDEAWRAAHGIVERRDAGGSWFDVPVASDGRIARLALRIRAAAGHGGEPAHALRLRRCGVGEALPRADGEGEADGPIAVGLVCLTRADEGGGLQFLSAEPVSLALRTSPGQLLLWFRRLADGRDDPAAAYTGTPVRRGVQTTLTVVLRASDA